MKPTPSKWIAPAPDDEVTGDEMRVAAARTTAAPWYVEPRPRRADVRGLPENTSHDYRGDAVATTGDSDFGAMPTADAEFAVMARNNWDRLMAAWDFAVDYARTSGDGPTCGCVPCRAARAVGNFPEAPRHPLARVPSVPTGPSDDHHPRPHPRPLRPQRPAPRRRLRRPPPDHRAAVCRSPGSPTRAPGLERERAGGFRRGWGGAVSGSDGLLFPSPVQSRETDERYTPSWIFEALGETFDLDPASPPLGVSRVPTAAVWTKDDDGLTKPWRGFVWCNPPFSHSTAWADRFMGHGCGIWLDPVANGGWHDRMTRTSDAMVLLRDFAFIGINHAQKRSSMPLSMHGYGHRAVAALGRFARLQPEAGVLLTRKADAA